MSSNTFGTLFAVTSFGESHGAAIGAVIDGCPPHLTLSAADIQSELDRRKPGTSRYVTQRRESDTVQILSGIYEGKTTGAPIALLIENEDQRSQDYGNLLEVCRPGHADYTYWKKYGIRDPRGGGRSSARLTAPIVGAAAIAKKWLHEHYGVIIRGCLSQLGTVTVPFESWDKTATNPFFAPTDDAGVLSELENFMDALRREGDSIGARVQVMAQQVPPGWGDPLFGKLDAEIAHAMMGINAVRGVEIGDGFDVVSQKGSVHGDEITPEGFLSNHAGGVLGGISTGQEIRVSIAVKPTPSIHIPRRSVDHQNQPVVLETHGRHDPCVGIRAVPVAEAMLALVLMNAALKHRAQCGEITLPQG